MKLLKGTRYSLTNKILMGAGAVIIFLLIIYLFTGGLTEIHSDSAAPLNLALEMIRTGSIFPDGWVGSTGIFVFQLPIFFFLHFIPNYLVAKAFAQALWTIIFLLSVIFVCRKLLNNHSWIVAIPMLLTCFSFNVQYDMLFIQCAYTATVFVTLYTIGFFGWAVLDFNTWKIAKTRFIFVWVLTLISCSLGIVLLEALLIPMLGSISVVYIYQHRNVDKVSALLYAKRAFSILVSIIIAGLIGYLGYLKLAARSGMVGNASATVLAHSLDQITENMQLILQGIFYYVGFSTGVSLFSLDGVLSIIRFVSFVVLTFIFPVLAYKHYKHESLREQLFLLFVLIHVVESLIVITFTQMVDFIGVSRYLLSSIVLLNIVSANYIYVHYVEKNNLLGFLYSIGISIVAVLMMLPVLKSTLEYQPILNDMRGLTTFLSEQNLTYGYSTFWNAGNNTVLSNGKVQINGVLISENQVSPYYWLTSEDWYEPNYYQGDTFLLLTSDEIAAYAPNGLEQTALGVPDEQLNYGDYTILVYDHNISENQFCGPLDGSKNYVPNAMSVSDPAMIQADKTVLIHPGQIMYGPYIDLETGEYELTVISKLQEPQEIKITASAGAEQICSAILKSEMTVIPFALDSEKTQIEFVFQNIGNTTFEVSEIRLEKVN